MTSHPIGIPAMSRRASLDPIFMDISFSHRSSDQGTPITPDILFPNPSPCHSISSADDGASYTSSITSPLSSRGMQTPPDLMTASIERLPWRPTVSSSYEAQPTLLGTSPSFFEPSFPRLHKSVSTPSFKTSLAARPQGRGPPSALRLDATPTMNQRKDSIPSLSPLTLNSRPSMSINALDVIDESYGRFPSVGLTPYDMQFQRPLDSTPLESSMLADFLSSDMWHDLDPALPSSAVVPPELSPPSFPQSPFTPSHIDTMVPHSQMALPSPYHTPTTDFSYSLPDSYSYGYFPDATRRSLPLQPAYSGLYMEASPSSNSPSEASVPYYNTRRSASISGRSNTPKRIKHRRMSSFTSFVNYTPQDAHELLNGVSKSGLSKRFKEQEEKITAREKLTRGRV